MNKEQQLDVLRNIEMANSQSSLANELGYSVGKINYIVKALIEKGFVKSEKFFTSDNKLKYRYLLTQAGIREKITITEEFIVKKKKEYDELVEELKDYQVKGSVL